MEAVQTWLTGGRDHVEGPLFRAITTRRLDGRGKPVTEIVGDDGADRAHRRARSSNDMPPGGPRSGGVQRAQPAIRLRHQRGRNERADHEDRGANKAQNRSTCCGSTAAGSICSANTAGRRSSDRWRSRHGRSTPPVPPPRPSGVLWRFRAGLPGGDRPHTIPRLHQAQRRPEPSRLQHRRVAIAFPLRPLRPRGRLLVQACRRSSPAPPTRPWLAPRRRPGPSV